MPIAPCATAGSISSTGTMRGDALRQAEPLEAGRRQERRIGDALLELAQPRLDVAAEADDLEVGPQRAAPAPAAAATRCRPTAPRRHLGERSALQADERVAHVLARQHARRSRARPAARVAMSFIECTARSISPASSASSISLVNSPLPPTSDSGRSWMRSPEVLMTHDLDPRLRQARARPSAAPRTSCACASASGEPRVPIRIVSVLARRRLRLCDGPVPSQSVPHVAASRCLQTRAR